MPDQEGYSALKAILNVSRETIDRLSLYEALVKKWNPTINLVAKSTISEIWSRHIVDSAQIWNLRPDSPKHWLDLGSGGGFPGLVIAAIADEIAPDMKVSLVESDARKSAFLLKAAQEMGIRPKIHIDRIESLEPQGADVISARALAPVASLLNFAERHRTSDTICLFSKGQAHEIELTEARKYWTFDIQKTPSVTDSRGVILKIGGFGRVRPK
jgi:16S rRNA (guanine527-N7)-methyltransferase